MVHCLEMSISSPAMVLLMASTSTASVLQTVDPYTIYIIIRDCTRVGAFPRAFCVPNSVALASLTLQVVYWAIHRPLSRRLDRCDRVIQKESGDPNGGNMCSFSGATGTSRVRHNARYVPYAQIRFDL